MKNSTTHIPKNTVSELSRIQHLNLHFPFSGDRKVPTPVLLLLLSDVLSFLGRTSVAPPSEASALVPSSSSTSSSSSSASSSSVSNATDFLFYFGVVSNVSLMLFIAQEHHLSTAYPHCASPSPCCASRLTSILKYTVPFAVLALEILRYTFWFAVALLAPFPLLLFFWLDSWRALACSRSSSRRLPPAAGRRRRRAAYGIGAIWVNYTVLYLPFALGLLLEELQVAGAGLYLGPVSRLLLYLGPMVDPLLYLFMTEGPREVLKALPCRRRAEPREEEVETVARVVDTRL